MTSNEKTVYGENVIKNFGEGDLVSYFPLGVKERQYGLIKKILIDRNKNFQTALAIVLASDGNPVKILLHNLRLENQAKRNRKIDEASSSNP